LLKKQSAASRPRPTRSSTRFNKTLGAPSSDGRNHEDLVALLKCIFLVAKKADVFFVYVKVDETPYLAIISAQVLAQRRETALDIGNQLRQIRSRARNLADVVGVLLKCVWQ
jgi:hypothetical protein